MTTEQEILALVKELNANIRSDKRFKEEAHRINKMKVERILNEVQSNDTSKRD